jgi:diguanylate cyclase (GGDEF)-like protein
MQQDMLNKKIANSENVDAEFNKKGIVDMETYKHNDTGAAAFKQVMSQMNIADRNAFDKKFTQQWNEASANKELLSVLVCEIDFFKEYTDNYGQQGASFMLLVIALALKNICEQNNYFLAQYDKEEFAILIKGSNPEKIAEAAENLRLAVENSKTEHKFSKINKIITLSIGVSSVYPKSMQMLKKLTNSALSNAKNGGRNKVFGHFPENDVKPSPTIKNTVEETPSKDIEATSEINKVIPPEIDEVVKKETSEIEKILSSEKEAEDELIIDIEDEPTPPPAKKRMFRLEIDDFFKSDKDKKQTEAAKQRKSKFKSTIDIDGGMF